MNDPPQKLKPQGFDGAPQRFCAGAAVGGAGLGVGGAVGADVAGGCVGAAVWTIGEGVVVGTGLAVELGLGDGDGVDVTVGAAENVARAAPSTRDAVAAATLPVVVDTGARGPTVVPTIITATAPVTRTPLALIPARPPTAGSADQFSRPSTRDPNHGIQASAAR